jgi:hypothetical protein
LDALYEMEQTWAAQPIPASSIRATYCFSNSAGRDDVERLGFAAGLGKITAEAIR